MRITLIGPVYPFKGGIAHYTTMLNLAIREQGHEINIISFKRQYPKFLYPGASDKDPSEYMLKPDNVDPLIDSINPLTWLTTIATIRAYQPDILILQWWTSFWAPVWFLISKLVAIKTDVKIVLICHNVISHEKRIFDRALTILGFSNITHFVVQSAEEKQKLKRFKPNANIYRFPHPPYKMFTHYKVSKQASRAVLKVADHAKILLFFGMIREYKGLDTLLRIMPKLIQKFPELKLIIAGEFWEEKSKYLNLIHNLEIKDQVLVFDYYIPNEEVGRYFSAADVIIAPYKELSGSGVLNLARGFNLPAIITAPPNSLNFHNGDLLIQYPYADDSDLIQVIINFFQDLPGSPAKISKNSKWSDFGSFLEKINHV